LFQSEQEQQQPEVTATTTSTTANIKPPRANVAVILSGCGSLDGTDIGEAVSLNVYLSRLNVSAQFFTLYKEIEVSVNYNTRQPDHGEERYMQKESARITRGGVKNLKSLEESSYDALFVLGGAGAVRNLANYELEKYNLEV
jgi:enhancing lycopene biosynthesis protein 2